MKHIIIGAGILGSSTAYHLAQKGEEVIIIDRGEPGQATNAGAGIICPWLTNRSNQAWYKLVMEGARYYPDLIQDLELQGETDTGYAQVGAINIFDTKEKLEKKMNIAEQRVNQTPEMGRLTPLNPSQTQEMFPVLAENYRALHISGGAQVNGSSVNRALLRAAERHGAQMIQGDARLLIRNGDVNGVSYEGGEIFSDQVIITNGAWSRELLAPLGLKARVSFEKAQIVHLQLPNTDTSHWPVVLPPFNHYMLTFKGGRVVIGATKEKGKMDVRVTPGGVHQLLDKALRVAPGLEKAGYIETRVGYRPFTPGSLPVLGRLPEFSNVLFANGLGASGLTSGPFVGSELAKLAVEEKMTLNLDDYPVDKAFK
ncbi:FAD-binding oxidoreductase [Halobacillus yeomjeoni]|uniref:NAD(P)/FAD-dependent oxidoreductase n=1 Tax=Halobacillus yeomjeoni TaxID=311194 RepID=UPI001CD2C61B|nr:FAD-dependent oxidoreductase [Halobacillus yeomjeoni]MCA0982935.1 FAD-binding oxidoreductase [Halobacillus yeomjeoni]